MSVPCIFCYFVLWPTNAQLFHKLSHSCYMFRHYSITLRELVISTLPSHTSISNAAVGNTLYNNAVPHPFNAVHMYYRLYIQPAHRLTAWEL